MSKIVFAFPGNELLARKLTDAINAEEGMVTIRKFPDGESFIQIHSDVPGKHAIVVATLDHPDDKILPLYYLCKKLRADGAVRLTLIAPYLPYMRQDKSFHIGEVITSDYFASFVSSFADQLITVDPHLHRHHSLDEVYSIPCIVLHSASAISKWISDHVNNPLLIGPDIESKQWVSEVAEEVNAPFIILEKERLDDQTVKISVPQVEQYRPFTPVFLDDIIATAHTMIETLKHLQEAKLNTPVCIGVHALFTDNAYGQLLNAGAGAVVTCNTVIHLSNQIDLSDLIVESVKGLS